MPLRLAALLVAGLLAACSENSAGGPAANPTPSSSPTLANPAAFDGVYGTYRGEDGSVFSVTRKGWFADLRDSTYRTLYNDGPPDTFSIGPGFMEPVPVAEVLHFGDGRLTITRSGRSLSAGRVELKQTDVTIPSGEVTLAATITEAPGPPPHPGIVVVQGSESGERPFYDFWVSLYTSLGLTVLAYDKRGRGSSTGRFPGEYASDQALAIYADDAAAALKFLMGWPGVDPRRVGFHGGSQGGWTVPLAMVRHPGAAFAVLVSAPAVTVGQQGVWSDFSNGGARLPSKSDADMYAAVRADHSGYDPTPALASLNVPVLWVLGRFDRSVPTELSVENLEALHKPNFKIQQVSSGHALLSSKTGLVVDDEASPGLAPEVIGSISGWIRQ